MNKVVGDLIVVRQIAPGIFGQGRVDVLEEQRDKDPQPDHKCRVQHNKQRFDLYLAMAELACGRSTHVSPDIVLFAQQQNDLIRQQTAEQRGEKVHNPIGKFE